MNLVLHVWANEVETLKGDKRGPGFGGAPFHLRSEISGFVAFHSFRDDACNRVHQENFLLVGVGFQDLGQLVALILRGRFQLFIGGPGHVLAPHHNNHFSLWQDGHVEIYMVGQMANLGSGNAIKAHFLRVRRQPEHGGGEKEELLLSLLFLHLAAGNPLGAFPVLMPLIVASPAFERLPSVGDEILMRLVRSFVVPPLLSSHMLLA